MLLVRPRNRLGTSSNDVEGNKYGHSGYAIPRQPIRVVLARDEEAAGIESEATKLQPPAYGLWRESVVSFIPARYLPIGLSRSLWLAPHTYHFS